MVNKGRLAKSIGSHCRLDPAAKGPRGQPQDDDWLVKNVTDDSCTLENTRTEATAVLGIDHIHSWLSDPERTTPTQRYGFLQLHVDVKIATTGRVSVTPLPPPRAAGPTAPTLNPLVLNDGDEQRSFTWRGRDQVHLIDEDDPRQLMGFYTTLCDALRRETELEPEFHDPNDIRGDIVYELSPDQRAKSRLLGGRGGNTGQAVLVLTHQPAKSPSSPLSVATGLLPAGPVTWQLKQEVSIPKADGNSQPQPLEKAEGLGRWDSFAIHNLWANRPVTRGDFTLWSDAFHQWCGDVKAWMEAAGFPFLDVKEFAELGKVEGGPFHSDPKLNHELVMLDMKRTRLARLIGRYRSAAENPRG